jgi:hypothetical protein
MNPPSQKEGLFLGLQLEGGTYTETKETPDNAAIVVRRYLGVNGNCLLCAVAALLPNLTWKEWPAIRSLQGVGMAGTTRLELATSAGTAKSSTHRDPGRLRMFRSIVSRSLSEAFLAKRRAHPQHLLVVRASEVQSPAES